MSAASEPAATRDPYWSLQRVRRALLDYHYFRLRIRPPRPDRPVRRGRRPAYDGEKVRVEIKADLDRALAWLAQVDNDPEAAAAIWAAFCDPALMRESLFIRINAVADGEGVGWRDVYQRIARGIEQMTRFLAEGEGGAP